MKFLDNGISPSKFWLKAAKAIRTGTAKLVSNRNDTGVSEEIRAYAGQLTHFTTFLLLQMQLNPTDFCKPVLYHKAAKLLSTANNETIITTTDNFQLVTIEA